MTWACHRLQSRDLVFVPTGLVNPHAEAGRLIADLHATAIDEHHHQLVLRIDSFGLTPMMGEIVDIRVTLDGQFATHFLGDPGDRPRHEGLLAPDPRNDGGLRKRFGPRGSLGDFVLEVGTIPTFIELQLRTLRDFFFSTPSALAWSTVTRACY
jgi:hypothetical protein